MYLLVTLAAAVILSLSCAFVNEAWSPSHNTARVGSSRTSRSIGYGLNGVFTDWAEARKACHSWGAALAFPNSREEFDILTGFLKDLDGTTREIHLGFHSEFVKGRHVTLDGLRLDEAGFRTWDPKSENSSSQRCGALSLSGLKTSDCSTLMWAVCENPSLSYVQIGDFGRYQYHEETRNWTDAVTACHQESGYLWVLRAQDEYDAVYAHFVERGVIGDDVALLYGAHHMFADRMFVTIADETLEASGYAEWAPDQPGNWSNNEYPLVNLLLSDATAPRGSFGLFLGRRDEPLPFICKMDLHTVV